MKINKRKIGVLLCCMVLLLSVLPAYAKESDDDVALDTYSIKIGYFEDDALHKGQSDTAVKSGYGYDYFHTISKYTGWKYEYVYGTKEEIYESFLNGEIDIVDDVIKTPEREKQMLFSDHPMGEEQYYIYIRENDENIEFDNAQSLNKKKIAVTEDNMDLALLKDYFESHKVKCDLVSCKNTEEQLSKLENQDVDAIIATNGFNESGYEPAFYIGSQPFYFAISKNRSELLTQLNTAHSAILELNPNFNSQLQDKYYKHSVIRTTLNSIESDWLTNHSTIRVGYRQNTMPFCDYDKDHHSDVGLLSDVLTELSGDLGISFDTTPYTDSDEMLTDLENGTIDIVFPVADNEWISEQQGFIQTSSLIEDRFSLVYFGDYKGYSAYKKFGYAKGSPAQKAYLMEHQLLDDATEYPTLEDCLSALKSGDIECIVMNADVWNYYKNSNAKFEQYNSVYLDKNVGYSFAVSYDNTILYSILESEINKLDRSLLIESLNRHSQVAEDYSIGNFIRYHLVLSILIFIAIISVAVVFLLKHQKTKYKNEYLKFSSEHDALTGVYNRTAFNAITKSLVGATKPFCITIVDIDNFKTINDTRGHDVGDLVIKAVADSLSNMVRSEDKVIRFGGDEFILILSGLTQENQNVLREKMRNVNKQLLKGENDLPPVSLSSGGAFTTTGYSDELFKQADNALYLIKKAGKGDCGFGDQELEKKPE